MNSETSTLAGRIKKIVGDNLSAFARRSGVGESLLRQYIAGSKPGLDKAVAIARAGGVSLEWLATGEEPAETILLDEAHPSKAHLTNQELEREFVRVEAALQGAREVPVPEYKVESDQALADARRMLIGFTARPDATRLQKAHADMLLRVFFGDRSAAERQEERLKAAGERLRWMNRAFEEAVKAVGFQPPPALAEIIKTLMFSHGLNAEGAVVLLDALREHLPPKWPGPKLEWQ